MKKVLTTAILAAFAIPVMADEIDAETPRLEQLETIVVTTNKTEPAQERLRDIETIVITAPKAQPADHEIDAKTASLLAEIDKIEK